MNRRKAVASPGPGEAAANLISQNAEASLAVTLENERDARGFGCKRVWELGEPILHVYHDLDGDFQFLCDGDEHTSPDEAVLIHAKHMFDLRPELKDIEDLAPGFVARRTSATGPWKRYEMCRGKELES